MIGTRHKSHAWFRLSSYRDAILRDRGAVFRGISQVSVRIAVAALLILGGGIALPAQAEENEGDSFAALAYLRVPFTAKPYLGLAVQKDRVEVSRPATRDYDTLWAQPKVIDVHLNPQTMEPVRVNGFAVYGGRSSRSFSEVAWSAHIDR